MTAAGKAAATSTVTRVGLIAVLCAAATFGAVTGADALWTADNAARLHPVQTGAVTFSVESAAAGAVSSVGGAAVELVVPGDVVGAVLDTDPLAPEPVIWRFTAAGAALGITGLRYDITPVQQRWDDGTTHDLSAGAAATRTVLAGSTMQLYRAGLGGDCSQMPAAPDGVSHIIVHDGNDVELQAPETNLAGATIAQEWCVAITWNAPADGAYGNDARADGTGADGAHASSRDTWRAVVAFPIELDPIGFYRNRAWSEGTGADGSAARNDDVWQANVLPNPDGEPDVVFRIDPEVTSARTGVPPGDHFVRPAP